MSFIAVAIGGAALIGAVSAGVSANAAGKAASTQSNAAKYAADLQSQNAQQALDFQKTQYNTSQTNAAPWLNAGQGAISNLSYLMGVPGSYSSGPSSASSPTGSPQTPVSQNGVMPQNGTTIRPTVNGFSPTSNLILGNQMEGTNGQPVSNAAQPVNGTAALNGATGQPSSSIGPNALSIDGVNPAATPNTAINTGLGGYGSLAQGWDQTFQAPTNVTEQNDPGYQFRLQQGQAAMDKSAAASGNLLTGGTANAEQQFGQNYGSNEYNNVYNRSLGEYQQSYNQFQNNQANEFNRLSAISGSGQVTANQLATTGQAAANNASNTMIASGQQVGQNINNAAAATASGYVGQANAINGGLSNLANSGLSMAYMNQMQNSQNAYNASQIPTGSSSLMSGLGG